LEAYIWQAAQHVPELCQNAKPDTRGIYKGLSSSIYVTHAIVSVGDRGL